MRSGGKHLCREKQQKHKKKVRRLSESSTEAQPKIKTRRISKSSAPEDQDTKKYKTNKKKVRRLSESSTEAQEHKDLDKTKKKTHSDDWMAIYHPTAVVTLSTMPLMCARW